mmetsp:Transcript_58609/g.165419  ORF Transcript_58609/g.165419 Transcript_58609/m.165419 type:complete len:524 (-) Transcript_58609:59-1630(-)
MKPFLPMDEFLADAVKFVRSNEHRGNNFGRRASSYYTMNPHTGMNDHVVIAMVGLPARGKSYISKAVVRYLQFIGCPAKLFNAGEKRRDKGLAGTSADFFDAANESAKEQREQMAMETMEEMFQWLRIINIGQPSGCACAILDATNTTRARRQRVMLRCAQEQPPVKLIFLESVCDDQDMLQKNYNMKLENNDYRGQDPTAALADFLARVQQYERVYEPVADEDFKPLQDERAIRYLKIINAGRRFIASNCDGYVLNKVLSLLHSIHLGPRTIWLAVVGETRNDTRNVLGGDSFLSDSGVAYANEIAKVINSREQRSFARHAFSPDEPAMVLCGTLRRYAQMAKILARMPERKTLRLNQLNDLCMGKLDSQPSSYSQLCYRHEHRARHADKLRYRYPGPGGESYLDVILRLQECILTLEQTRSNIIVLCDRAVCRALLAYFQGTEIEEMPTMQVEAGLHELHRSHSGFTRSHIPIRVGAATATAGPGTAVKFQRPHSMMRLPQDCCYSFLSRVQRCVMPKALM